MLLPPKHHRLWRRRLRRRPLLPFLLAATLALDLVLAVVLPGAPDEETWVTAGQSALVAQLALVATWCVHSPRSVPLRLLAGLAFAFVQGWWCLSTPGDNLAWFSFLSLTVFILVAVGVFAISRRKGLHGVTRGFGIAGLLAWTTIAVIAIAPLRDANPRQVVSMLSDPPVLFGLLFDVAVFATALYTAVRGWSIRASIAVVAIVAFALPNGGSRYEIGDLLYGFMYMLGSNGAAIRNDVLHSFGQLLVYEATFAATLLVWLLGLRSRGRTIPPHATYGNEAAQEASGTTKIDATV